MYFVQHSFFLALARNCQIWLVMNVDFCINFHHLPNLDNGNFLAFPLNIFCILAKEHFQILLCNPCVKKLWRPSCTHKKLLLFLFWLFSILDLWLWRAWYLLVFARLESRHRHYRANQTHFAIFHTKKIDRFFDQLARPALRQKVWRT